MTRATPPMTMAVSAPMTQAASRSVAAAASGVLGARGVVSVTGDANLGPACAQCPRVSSVPLLFAPRESARYYIKTGEVLGPPAPRGVASYTVRVRALATRARGGRGAHAGARGSLGGR